MHFITFLIHLTIILCALVPLGYAQDSPNVEQPYAWYQQFQAIDSAMVSEEAKAIPSVAALVNYIRPLAPTDTLKARAIFRWLAEHVAYDAKALFTGQFPDQSSTAIMKRRISVCQGYANVFADVAKGLGMTVEIITGYARNLDQHIGTPFKAPNHAWNAVKINGRWMLVDATWGAGLLVNNIYHRRLANIFFLIPPSVLIYTHMPKDAQWQMLPKPITMQQFIQQPIPGYLSNLRIISPQMGVLHMGSTHLFEVEVEDATEIYLIQGDAQKPENRTLLSKDGTRFSASAKVKNKDVFIFAKYPHTGENYMNIVKYRGK